MDTLKQDKTDEMGGYCVKAVIWVIIAIALNQGPFTGFRYEGFWQWIYEWHGVLTWLCSAAALVNLAGLYGELVHRFNDTVTSESSKVSCYC